MSNTLQKHPFHLVDPSPWPIFTSLAAFTTTFGGVMFMHGFVGGDFALALGLMMIIYSMFVWWRDVIRESTFEGHHTLGVQAGLPPTIDIGAVWPPKGLEVLNPWEVPFLNTLILLTSGASVTWAHHAILAGHRTQAIYALIVTLRLGIGIS
eukprot:9503758-Pyramimonas_sp.AAC.1